MFHVVQIARADPKALEIIKSFKTRREALLAAETAFLQDRTNYFEYVVSGNPDELVITGDDPF